MSKTKYYAFKSHKIRLGLKFATHFRSKIEVKLTSKFIGFDHEDKKFYDNIYLDDFKIVVKIPLIDEKDSEPPKVKMEKFNIGKYALFLSYD